MAQDVKETVLQTFAIPGDVKEQVCHVGRTKQDGGELKLTESCDVLTWKYKIESYCVTKDFYNGFIICHVLKPISLLRRWVINISKA